MLKLDDLTAENPLLLHGDCLEVMKTLPDKSVDLLVCDLPYGETNCSWDTKIDLTEFWRQFKRIRKSKKTACIHFCSTGFGYTLIKSWEKGFKMDLVWKKRNKTGGLQSRFRPMRNHEMVYFFYEQAPKYNRDKYHKRIATQNVGGEKNGHGFDCGGQVNFGAYSHEPPNPASILEPEPTVYGATKADPGWWAHNSFKGNENPASVLEEKEKAEHRAEYWANQPSERKTGHGWDKAYMYKPRVPSFEPSLPPSVVEEEEKDGVYSKACGGGGFTGCNGYGLFDPANPVSVVEEEEKKEVDADLVYKMGADFTGSNGYGAFDPANPASVVEEEKDGVYSKAFGGAGFGGYDGGPWGFEPPLPVSMFESGKCPIGKRNHQTEKPQDILEFFLKYWSDPGDVILDPTMGSGSTGVACKRMGRKFIGIEITDKYYAVAQKRISEQAIIEEEIKKVEQ